MEHGQLATVKSKPRAVPTCAGGVIALPTTAYLVFPFADHLKMGRVVLTLGPHQSSHRIE